MRHLVKKELMFQIFYSIGIPFERYSKDNGIFTGRWPHAYETTAIAKAGSAMRLIRRCFVIVEGEVRLAGRWIHADRVADQNFALAALAQLGTFWLILAIQLYRIEHTRWFKVHKLGSESFSLDPDDSVLRLVSFFFFFSFKMKRIKRKMMCRRNDVFRNIKDN